MKFRLFIVFLLSSFIASAQVTNTKKWRKTENDSMQQALLLYDEGNFGLALPIYEKLYQSHPKEDFLKFVYGRCCLSRSDKHEEALQLLTSVYAKNKKAENIEHDLARAHHYNYKFDSAAIFVDQYLARKKILPEERIKAEQLKKYITNAKIFYSSPTNAKITNAGPVLNSSNSEYVPVISADESVLIFTYVGSESKGGRQNAFLQPDNFGAFFEDIFQSDKVNDQWSKPYSIDSINTNSHDAAIAMSPDGQQLFSYKDNGDDHGDIYVSYLSGNQWSKPQRLKGQVNSYAWEGSCSLTSDGKTLYFSSEKSGGYGGRDIYRATMMPDSSWGNVVNLGDSINTTLDDDAPFIHPDGITLFYSSKAKNSMGDYDIFQASMNPMDSMFRNAVNLGYPINTPDGDRYYVLSANGKTGYYSSGKKGGYGLQDIYTVDPGYVGKRPCVQLVKGKITFNGEPVVANITVEITSKNNKIYKELSSNPAKGNYMVTLPPGAIYKLIYKYKENTPRTLDVDASNLTEYNEKEFDLEFFVKPDTAKVVAMPDTLPKVVIAPKVDKKPDNFVPKTAMQAKIKLYAEKYGDISAEGLEFKVQVAAYKYPRNYSYPHLKGLGKVEQLLLPDGITRITIGGTFNTLGKAYEHNKKVIKAGQTDAFVTALYKGKRVFLEELEEMGIFPKK
jgi:hypothetical protein